MWWWLLRLMMIKGMSVATSYHKLVPHWWWWWWRWSWWLCVKRWCSHICVRSHVNISEIFEEDGKGDYEDDRSDVSYDWGLYANHILTKRCQLASCKLTWSTLMIKMSMVAMATLVMTMMTLVMMMMMAVVMTLQLAGYKLTRPTFQPHPRAPTPSIYLQPILQHCRCDIVIFG